MSQQRGPADNLKDAYNRLELDLRNPTDFEAIEHREIMYNATSKTEVALFVMMPGESSKEAPQVFQ